MGRLKCSIYIGLLILMAGCATQAAVCTSSLTVTTFVQGDQGQPIQVKRFVCMKLNEPHEVEIKKDSTADQLDTEIENWLLEEKKLEKIS